MKVVDEFQQRFGSRWTGVKFFFEEPREGGIYFPKETRFCEAVSWSFSSQNLLKRGCINCMGANYVFGWKGTLDEVIENFQKNRNVPPREAASIVQGLPRMEVPPIAIGLNGVESPDVIVACLQPQQFMRLLEVYQGVLGETLKADLSGYAAVCGNVVVKAYITEKIALSFGCEDSRQYGGISRDRLIVGIPNALAHQLLG